MVIPAPSLSAAGWVTSPAEKADLLLSHFYASVKNQTSLYGNNVSNLQWLVQRYGHDVVSLVTQVRSNLEVYLGRYYPAVNVEVGSNDSPSNDTNQITLRVFCQVTENGKQYSFGRLITTINSKIEKIILLNN